MQDDSTHQWNIDFLWSLVRAICFLRTSLYVASLRRMQPKAQERTAAFSTVETVCGAFRWTNLLWTWSQNSRSVLELTNCLPSTRVTNSCNEFQPVLHTYMSFINGFNNLLFVVSVKTQNVRWKSGDIRWFRLEDINHLACFMTLESCPWYIRALHKIGNRLNILLKMTRIMTRALIHTLKLALFLLRQFLCIGFPSSGPIST